MAYADFTLRGLIRQFALTTDEQSDLFSHVAPVGLDPVFVSRLLADIMYPSDGP
jgi:hypothetical protein